jgi:methylthioribose-1-phosphate isomerase
MRLSDVKEGLLLWGLPLHQGITAVMKKVRADQGVHILVPEMRPHMLGLVIAKRLQEEGIKPVYATDNMLGLLFYQGKVKEVIFFYKELVGHDIVGICGSLYVCLLAYEHGVPIQLLAGDAVSPGTKETSVLDGRIRFQYNDMIRAVDETVSKDIIQ